MVSVVLLSVSIPGALIMDFLVQKWHSGFRAVYIKILDMLNVNRYALGRCFGIILPFCLIHLSTQWGPRTISAQTGTQQS